MFRKGIEDLDRASSPGKIENGLKRRWEESLNEKERTEYESHVAAWKSFSEGREDLFERRKKYKNDVKKYAAKERDLIERRDYYEIWLSRWAVGDGSIRAFSEPLEEWIRTNVMARDDLNIALNVEIVATEGGRRGTSYEVARGKVREAMVSDAFYRKIDGVVSTKREEEEKFFDPIELRETIERNFRNPDVLKNEEFLTQCLAAMVDLGLKD